MIKESGLIRLKNNPVKEYAWGRPDHNCFVGRLSQKFGLASYAELWMGVHCHGQSEITTGSSDDESVKLSEFLLKNNFKPIQFLFKVLSIQKCLSIQVHPNKAQASSLNKLQPLIYSDDNDKPEMFYTLTVFQCFFGYLNVSQFNRIMSLELFKGLFSQTEPKNPRQAIIQILKLNNEQQNSLIQKCVDSLESIHPQRYQGTKGKTKIWNILNDFPNDIGIVVSFFLGYMVLEPGVCCYIQCNTPHAYIHGECLQIMKNSDNVCRLGLTPKFKDLKVISEVLVANFDQIKPIQGQIQTKKGWSCRSYSEKGLNLKIIKSNNESGSSKYQINPIKADRILLVLHGTFKIRSTSSIEEEKSPQGTVILLKSETPYEIESMETMGQLCVGWSCF